MWDFKLHSDNEFFLDYAKMLYTLTFIYIANNELHVVLCCFDLNAFHNPDTTRNVI